MTVEIVRAGWWFGVDHADGEAHDRALEWLRKNDLSNLVSHRFAVSDDCTRAALIDNPAVKCNNAAWALAEVIASQESDGENPWESVATLAKSMVESVRTGLTLEQDDSKKIANWVASHPEHDIYIVIPHQRRPFAQCAKENPPIVDDDDSVVMGDHDARSFVSLSRALAYQGHQELAVHALALDFVEEN